MSIGKWILFLNFLKFNSFLKFYIGIYRYILHWNLVNVIYAYALRNLYILYKFYSFRLFDYSCNNNLIMFLYKRNYVLYFKTYFCFVIEPLSSEHQYNKYWQSCSNAVFSNSKQRRRIFVDSIFIFNQKSTLKQLGSPTLNRRNSFNVVSTLKQTLIIIRRLNFHFQPNFNVETTLMNADGQLCFNVDSTLMCLLGNELTSN